MISLETDHSCGDQEWGRIISDQWRSVLKVSQHRVLCLHHPGVSQTRAKSNSEQNENKTQKLSWKLENLVNPGVRTIMDQHLCLQWIKHSYWLIISTLPPHWCKMNLPTLTWFFQSFIILSFLQSSQSKPAQVSQNFKKYLLSAKIFHSLTRLFMNQVWFGQIFSDIVSWQGASLLHQTFRHQPTSLFLLVNRVNTVLWLVGCQESVDE